MNGLIPVKSFTTSVTFTSSGNCHLNSEFKLAKAKILGWKFNFDPSILVVCSVGQHSDNYNYLLARYGSDMVTPYAPTGAVSITVYYVTV